MNPQEKENRADQREEKNRDERRKEKPDTPSRLGKEAKIGVAVILLLLGTFAAVVAVKMSKGDSGDKQLAAADHEGERHKPPAGNGDSLFGDIDSKSFGHQRTMVPPAKTASTALPGSIDSKLDKWKLPEKSEPTRVQSRYGAPIAPPSFGDPPKPSRGSRYDAVAGDPLPPLEQEKPSRFGKKPNDLPPPPLDVKKRPAHVDSLGSATTRESFERGESSGYADAGSPPRHREKSRYDDAAAALMAPAPPPRERSYDGGGRSYAGSSRSQYDDDFPRDSGAAAYDRDRPHHYDSPPLRRDGKYEVEPNDNYWTISEKVYGTGGYFRALAEQNRSRIGNADRLTPGDVILAPSVAQLERAYPELCPKQGRREAQESRTMAVSTRASYRGGRTYTVSEGDTQFNIARYELGKASRWAEIYDLNREVLGKDFNYLTPGMKLVLPDNEKADVLTRKSGDLYR